jgi:hypothetical protein
MRKLVDFLRKLLHRPIEKAEVTCEPIELVQDKTTSEEERVMRSEPLLSARAIVVRRSGVQATRQDIGKFMKHGRQAPWYRKSVKAKVKLEDED